MTVTYLSLRTQVLRLLETHDRSPWDCNIDGVTREIAARWNIVGDQPTTTLNMLDADEVSDIVNRHTL